MLLLSPQTSSLSQIRGKSRRVKALGDLGEWLKNLRVTLSFSMKQDKLMSTGISIVKESKTMRFEETKCFSYLNLLEQQQPTNGKPFPHRTQPIMDGQKRSGSSSISSSMEYLNHTSKTNFMVRSNPIGLPEPSVKRDGLASAWGSSESVRWELSDFPNFWKTF